MGKPTGYQVTGPGGGDLDTTQDQPIAPDTSSDDQAERETADDSAAVSRETRVEVVPDEPAEGADEA